MKRVLTLDLGTTACKACCFDLEGELLAFGSSPYPTDYPEPGWAEQSADDWWLAAKTALGQALSQLQDRDHFAAIGLSSQRETAVLLGASGEQLGPALVWMDRRSAEQANELAERFGRLELQQRTGLVPDATFTATKLLWLKQNAPEQLARMATFLQPKDYLAFRMTGQATCDLTLASRTLMLDLRLRQWDPELVEAAGAREDQLPRLVDSTEIVGELVPEVATELGLPAGLPVVSGAGDRACEAVGAMTSTGRAMESTGTTTNVSLPVARLPEALDPRVICSVHALPGHWLVEQGMSATGSLMKWLRDELYGGAAVADYDEIDTQSAAIPPGAEGLVILPFFMGARSTRWNPAARGLISGLSLGHTKAHLARAAREGIACEIAACFELLAGMGYAPGQVAMMGGASVSDLFAKIKASMANRPFLRLKQAEASSVGAAALAFAGVGLLEAPLEYARRANPVVAHFDPVDEWVELYGDLRARYEALWAANAPLFE